MTNPSASISPTPMPRSITTLVSALRQSQPSRTSSQARTPSPMTPGRTWVKNAPMVVTAIMAVIGWRGAASAARISFQRSATGRNASVTTSSAKPSQPMSSCARDRRNLRELDLARDIPQAPQRDRGLDGDERGLLLAETSRRRGQCIDVVRHASLTSRGLEP